MCRSIHLTFIVGLLILFSNADLISITNNLSGLQTPTTPQPPNCLVWNQAGCEICDQGFAADAKGVCKKDNGGIKSNDIIQSQQFGQTVGEDFDPCPGKSNCVGNAFQNKKEFDAFMENAFPKDILYYQPLPLVVNDQPQIASEPAVAQNRDFSGTNNQEENVDEADILKTDGTYIYTISNKILSIVRAYPRTDINVLATYRFEDFFPSAIFIDGDYLAVFGTDYSYSQYRTFYYQPSSSKTLIKIFDVSNRSKPTLIKDYSVAGSYFNGRKTEDGFMYLLTTTWINSYEIILPWYNFNGKQVDFAYRDIFYYGKAYSYPLFVSIFSINLRNPLKNEKGLACLVVENSHNIYMSEKAIYISYTDYNIGTDSTVIHKIFVKKTRVVPFAIARVRGTINNQFSFDQFNQVLRVATTSNQVIDRARVSSNNIYCLDFFLNQIGFLGKIAPGQRIFSARFADRRLYLVTFRQVDPFFVISFRNHRQPQILGELKITGFSRYLHIYDQNTVIGLGRQADLNGRQLGLKISIFDVTDVTNPREADNFELEEKYAYSDAEWEHKAFLFSRTKNLLVIPGQINNEDIQFNGAFAFYVDASTIVLRGLINHVLSDRDQFYLRNVERSLYIEELLYTKSPCLIRVNRIFDLKNVKNVALECDREPIIAIDPIPLEPIPPIPVSPAIP